ncbi:hypothetical protein NNC19_16800 [Clostridium sp. SHJSY1]|uniref:hypothetical protein n=1 Tax=Clostridium sp. SHJSY1 TaxID=2942483 RepID=UPI002874CCAF|nr:hypothetical protein [Clostridium sp. SHJSY1]MDS0527351.1 hypothetical protein [Clostridium sp. SHJSY1]
MTQDEIEMMLNMPQKEFKKYLDTKYKNQISELQAQGYSDKDLHRQMDLDRAALKAAGIKPSYLIPTSSPQLLECEDWECHIPYEGKWEFIEGTPLLDEGYSRDTLAMALIANMGLNRLIDILPTESINELKKIMSNT